MVGENLPDGIERAEKVRKETAMREWTKDLPFMVAGLLRTVIRGLIGLTLVFLAFFLAWCTYECVTHCRKFLGRTIFGHDW